jgi:hypothetical protein
VSQRVSRCAPTVRGVYPVTELAARYALVPLAVASLLTGLVQALGTTCGLLRHYWVPFKLLINLFATELDQRSDTRRRRKRPDLPLRGRWRSVAW